MVSDKNPFVYLDIKIGEEKVGRIVLELFKEVCPLTSENFRALCTGEKGIGELGKPLHYKGCLFHKAVSQFMIQSGDITNQNGTGGESIYGHYFHDENFLLKHTDPGVLSMATAGKDLNNSQFFITTVPCPHLDNTNVVFGQVRAGLGVVEEVSTTVKDKNDRPLKNCVISDCGEYKPGEDWHLEEDDGTADIYPPFPEDWKICDPGFEMCETVIANIRVSGNHFFRLGNNEVANSKYKKALRYIEWSKVQCKDEPNRKRLDKTEVFCLLNLAAVYMKMERFREAWYKCNEALKIDGKCAKGFYRRALASIRLNDYAVALEDLQTAKSILPNDRSIQSEIKSVKKTIQKYLVLEKQIFEKMLKT